MTSANAVEVQVARYVSYLNGKDGLPGWLEALDLECRRRHGDKGYPYDCQGGDQHLDQKAIAFVREWVRIKRLYS